MDYQPHEAFRRLYDVYTGENSVGQHLTSRLVDTRTSCAILVVTGSDYVLFPGQGARPIVQSFRLSTRGFVELTAVSHLGPALAWIFRLREIGYSAWRDDAERLLASIAEVRAINDASYWLTHVAVESFQGRESKIADLVDYACVTTERFMRGCLSDERKMTYENMRQEYLEPVDDPATPVPINDVMVATFALAFLDIAHRIIRWLRSQELDWRNLAVLFTGPSGRPSSGLTWQTNNACYLLWKASGEHLPPGNVLITPHGPAATPGDLADPERARRAERAFREIWMHLWGGIEMSRLMFAGFPSFSAAVQDPPVIEAGTKSLRDMPRLRTPDDRFTAITRLRLVMEDPRQLLSNCVAHFVIDQLCENGVQPELVVVPGFTNVAYPVRVRARSQ
jgi:hypothetical protein